MTKDLSHLLPSVIEVARSAGQLILEIYEKKDYEEYTKSDDTPVTSADLAAHKLISQRLSELTPDTPEIGRAHVWSSHTVISYAVFCLKKKKKETRKKKK